MSEWDEREPDQAREPVEGVRIIGPEEAAEAARRGQSQRRTRDRPRESDRPGGPPPPGQRPALRFPLEASDDAELIERPRVAPTDQHRPPTEVPHWGPSAVEEVPNMPRDPYEGDESAAWSSYGGAGPRWRDDDPGGGYDPRQQAPGRGRGPAAPSGEPPPAYDDDVYAEPPPGRSVFGDQPGAQSYEDSYSDQGYDADAYAEDEEYDDEVYDDQYDDEYVDDRQTFVEAPVPPMAPRRSAGRREAARRAPASERGGSESDMPTRIAVGVGMAVAALILFKIGPVATMFLVVPVIGLAAYEYFTATQRAGFDPLMPVGVAASVAAVLVAYNYGDMSNGQLYRGESAVLLVMFLTVVVSLVWYLIDAGGERPMANVGATLLGVVWVGLFGSFAGLLLAAPNGIALLLAALVPTIGYDTGALFVGRSARSPHPLSAASPNKTVEGLVGGMVLAVVGGVALAAAVHPFTISDGLLIGVVAAVVAPLGDLSESLIKRDLGIKDMGSLLPGHGGVLDRFDALLFVLPAIWYLSRASDFFLT